MFHFSFLTWDFFPLTPFHNLAIVRGKADTWQYIGVSWIKDRPTLTREHVGTCEPQVINVNTLLSRAGSWLVPTGQQQSRQLSAKGDELVSKFTNYVEERSSSSSSSGINTTLISMTPQNSELQNQDSYLHDYESIVTRWRWIDSRRGWKRATWGKPWHSWAEATLTV